MPKLSRLLTVVAALLLAIAIALPVWRIRLIAPQYPEGLGMQIRLHTVEGVKEHDLANINELNHYIGMRAIDPEVMPELRYLPWVVGALAAAGLAVAAAGRRRALYVWLAGFGAAAVAGLADMWRWTYTYGHHLDTEHAIIKVPGTVYQPPILGTRQILNFTASSWPAAGGILIVAAFVLAATAAWMTTRRTTRRARVAGGGSSQLPARTARLVT